MILAKSLFALVQDIDVRCWVLVRSSRKRIRNLPTSPNPIVQFCYTIPMSFESNWQASHSDPQQEIADGLQEWQDERNHPLEDMSSPYPDPEREDTVSFQLEPASDLFADEDRADAIYAQYASAMERRGRDPLGYARFMAHFNGGSTEPLYGFGDDAQGYLLGFSKSGVFIPTHFAPKSMRSGYILMKQLGESKYTPCVMSITEDLIDTIKKMPCWHTIDASVVSRFMDGYVEKGFAYNEHPDIDHLKDELVAQFIAEGLSRNLLSRNRFHANDGEYHSAEEDETW